MQTQILYEDNDILVCYKPAGIATQTGGFAKMDVVSELKNYLAKEGKKEPYLGLIQRLDQPVEGVLVFGKNSKATAVLNQQIADKTMKKQYLATVFLEDRSDSDNSFWKEKELHPVGEQITLTDYLQKDSKTNLSKVVSANNKEAVKAAKKAELTYTITKKEKIDQGYILYVKIDLHTGRHHQIRVQLSHAGMPLLGDLKYGTDLLKQVSQKLCVPDVALCAQTIQFRHPSSKKPLAFTIKPQKTILQNVTE